MVGYAGYDPESDRAGSQGGCLTGEIHFSGLSFLVVTHHAFGGEDGFDVGGKVDWLAACRGKSRGREDGRTQGASLGLR